MPRPLNQTAVPSQELRHFTNRMNELQVFRNAVDLPAGTPLPVLMFYGVGGIGKSWLLRRLRQELAGTLPSALLDFEPSTGGTPYHADSAAPWPSCGADSTGVVCPRFDLAYSWLRHKEGSGDTRRCAPEQLGRPSSSSEREPVSCWAEFPAVTC